MHSHLNVTDVGALCIIDEVYNSHFILYSFRIVCTLCEFLTIFAKREN